MRATLSFQAILRNSLLVLALFLVPAARAKTAEVQAPVIVASHPLASEAGAEMLRRGGSAVDAAIAAQMVMTLVEPQSSGIGGGLFLLHHDPRTGSIENYDGRERAPASVTPNLFMGADGKPLGFIEAAVGGRSVGVPGAVAALWLAHREHGKLDWAELFKPAIRLAREGFPVSPRLAKVIGMVPSLDLIPATAAYFKPGGRALAAGDILRNPALADTLQRIADQGPDGFYKGPVAQAIVDAVVQAPRGAVALTLKDLQSFRPSKRPTLCGTYRAYRICGMRPPSSGGIATLQILKLLERFDMGALEPGSAAAMHLFVEAQRLAFADRAAFLGDPDFVPVPVTGLLSWPYLRQRSQMIDPARALPQAMVLPGDPRGARLLFQRLRIPDHSKPSTAHLSVIDGKGRAVAMTTTVEGPFGSHMMAAGFMLNNQLSDFAFEPTGDNRRFANAPAAGKRPLSSMSPTLVFDARGRLYAVIGSPGGWRIIPYVSKTLLGLIDWKMDMEGAIGLPNVTSRSGVVEIEKDRGLEAVGAALSALGHEVRFIEQTSGLNGLRIVGGRIDAAADPRREGAVR
ncbi:MAG: gamma-glutamyltransferase [Alphaproteobacteria bacterium]|nr:gamma-glutamyltransferase [Alphaproteobacteria bacterium]